MNGVDAAMDCPAEPWRFWVPGVSPVTKIFTVVEARPEVAPVAVMMNACWGSAPVGVPLIEPVEEFKVRPAGRAG